MISVAGTVLAQSMPWIPSIWIDENGSDTFDWISNISLLILVGCSSLGLYPLMFTLIPEIGPENVRPKNCPEKRFKSITNNKTFFQVRIYLVTSAFSLLWLILFALSQFEEILTTLDINIKMFGSIFFIVLDIICLIVFNKIL